MVVGPAMAEFLRWSAAALGLRIRSRAWLKSPADDCSAPGPRPPPIALRQSCDAVRWPSVAPRPRSVPFMARAGKAKAITAAARKLTVLVDRVLSANLAYQDPGATAYHMLNRTRELKSLRKRAKLLGFDLVDRSAGEVVLKHVSWEEAQPCILSHGTRVYIKLSNRSSSQQIRSFRLDGNASWAERCRAFEWV
jgi:hypothetical protein